MAAASIRLGNVPVGDGYPPVFVAEVGTFFNQDMDTAHAYLDAVAAAGADIFKTEILHDADVCLPGTGLQHAYTHAAGRSVEDYRALIERKVVPLEAYAGLFAAAADARIPVMASVYDRTGVDFVREHQGSALKIARNNVDNLPLIRYAAASRLPIVFDMGDVLFEEIARAVREAREAGAGEIAVNLHPGSNPAPAGCHDLRACDTIRAMFDVPVGLSCHYRGEEILYAAVGAGINLLEKGVDADPDRPEQDLVSALPLADLEGCIRRVKACWEALGAPRPTVSSERDLSVRACLIANRDLSEGETVTVQDLAWAFPPVGISVADTDRVVGRRVNRALERGGILEWEFLDRVG